MVQPLIPKSPKNNKKRKFKPNKRLIIILVCVAVFMYAFSYLLVPIFTFACKQLGINGKGVMSATVAKADMQVDKSRTIKVEFASRIQGNFGFKFVPLQRRVEVHPGERKLIYFYAENQTGVAKTIQAVPSITPADGARFFKKIECFCFTQQYFTKGEKADMFVNFYIDPAIPKDVKEMTLSYTLFDATGYEKKGQRVTKGRIRL